VLRRALEGDPGSEWRALARRLVSAIDGERLVAALLAHSYASVEGMPVVAKPRPVPSPAANDVQPRPPVTEPREGERGRDGDRDRFRDRDRDRPRFAGRDRGPRDRGRPGGDRDRPRLGDRDRPRAPVAAAGDDHAARRHERRPPPPLRNDPPPAEREFWEVWSEEKAQQGDTGGAPPTLQSAPTLAPTATPFESTSPGIGEGRHDDGPRTDVARLYLNLGRKDGASEKEIRDLLSTYADNSTVVDVDVMNTHTYLNVAPADADRIITAVTGKEMCGRQLICETAKPRRR
jgi:hypothetical protein